MLRAGREGVLARPLPFPVMHVDTGHNFPEVLEFRDRRVAELGARLVVASVQESIDAGRVDEETGRRRRRNRLQTTTLLDAIEETGSTPCSAGPGATRRRRGPRSGSSPSATSSASGTRRTSGPSCGTCTTAGIRPASTSGSSRCRNWTELDIWQYIERREHRAAVDLLRPRARGVRARRHAAGGQPVRARAATARQRSRRMVRYRTVGDVTCTGAVESDARRPSTTVIVEVAATRITERGATRGRRPHVSEAAMEDRKREGYF